MELDEQEVARGLDRLAMRSFARGIHPSHGRVMRYRQELGEALHLHPPERAVLSVLMLRGPQTPGEIRTRTTRAAEFVNPSHVEIVLDSLATLSTPLVAALPRGPGQKEVRYTHLLAGAPSLDEPGTEPSEASSPQAPPRPQRAETVDRGAPPDRMDALEREVGELRAEVAELRGQLQAFRQQFE
jgi:uncharacterized protein YceH (UPF0502 family)